MPTPNSEKTVIVDLLAGLPKGVRDHLRDVAEESGMETVEYRSHNEALILADGQTLEIWYDEDASSSLCAWKGFVAGIGTLSGSWREEVIARFATGHRLVPVGMAYDPTATGVDRFTHTASERSCVKQPFMSSVRWEQDLAAFFAGAE